MPAPPVSCALASTWPTAFRIRRHGHNGGAPCSWTARPHKTRVPGFIPVAGTNPAAFSQGDELIINDQVTVTHKRGNGYPIVGFDSGVYTLTRVPEKFAEQTLGNCVVSVVWKDGSLTVQGVVRFKQQKPQSAVLAVTGGTGRYHGATGVVDVAFAKNHKILTFKLK